MEFSEGTDVGVEEDFVECRSEFCVICNELATEHFLAHVCCGQTAGWIKMPFGMEVGLVPGRTVLDGNPAPPIRGTAASNFRTVSIVAKWLDGSTCHLVWR